MSYFGFLAIFLLIPIALLTLNGLRNRMSGAEVTPQGQIRPWAIALFVIIAVVYTTPWDNYLVATGVWWYDPDLVTGLVLGWVPIEEYTFFVLQPILIGLWLAFWLPRIKSVRPDIRAHSNLRRRAVLIAGVVWTTALWLLLFGQPSWIYLSLELVWALPPIILQLGYGADILRQNWRLMVLGIVIPTIYLSAADALAIGWGTWTIDPGQSTGVLIGGILPVEEFIFFALTNTLLTFGLILVHAPESRVRAGQLRDQLRRMIPRRSA